MADKGSGALTPSGSRPSAPRRTSSSNQSSMPAYGISPNIPNIPPRSPWTKSPSIQPQGTSHSGDTDQIPDSDIPTPNDPSDLDSLPISDEQKARIIERHLSRAGASNITLTPGDGEGGSSRSRSRPSSQVDSAASAAGSDQGDDHDEGYQGPHHLQGGAINDDLYRWAHNNKRKTPRRARSESVHIHRASIVDPSLEAIKEPGGFRRFFVLNQAAEQGRPPPRMLRSLVDFLALYGHYAGEDLEDMDSDEEDEEAENDVMENGRAIAGTSREASNGTTETSALLRSRRKLQRGGSRIRRRSSRGRERGEATVTDAVLMLLKSFVGTGILFLGKAFHNGGLLFSILVLCAVAMISLASFLLLVKANLVTGKSFGDMGGVLYGPKMRLAILTSIVFSQLGFVAAYTVFVAQNLQAFVLAVTHCKTLIPTVYLILAQSAVFLPLSLVRKIAKLSSTALIADVFILLGIIYLFSFEIKQIAQRGVADVVQFNSKSFSLLIGTAVFTFEGVGLVIPITESMANPSEFPKALSGVMIFVMLLFASSGALSYMAFGSKVQTVVISNLPQSWKFVQALQFLYSLAILLSTPLQLFPAVSILERGLFSSKSGKRDFKIKLSKNLFRCSIVLVATFAAWLGSSSLDVFVSFIGSVACVPLCFIYPPLLHLRACATKRRTIILDYMLLAFGILCMGFAGSQTIRTLIVGGGPPDQPVCSPPK